MEELGENILIRPKCSLCKNRGRKFMCAECYGYPDGRAENSFEPIQEKAEERSMNHAEKNDRYHL